MWYFNAAEFQICSLVLSYNEPYAHNEIFIHDVFSIYSLNKMIIGSTNTSLTSGKMLIQ